MTKEEVLKLFDSLGAYLEEGIHDYLKDNDLRDYMEHGDFRGDYEKLQAVVKLREFIEKDEYPWWEVYP